MSVSLSQSLVPAVPGGTLPALQGDLDRAASYARAEKADATRRAYRNDFELFKAWAVERGVGALPATPETVAAFIAAEAERGVKPSTIGRRVAAIRYAHRLAGLPVPTADERVKAVVRGIRREKGVAPLRKSPVTSERAIAMAAFAGQDVAGLRDRAILLLGFAGAFRRSELVALDVEDLEETEAGLRVRIRRSKTDQDGAGATIAIVAGSIACPVKAVQAWRLAASIKAGPLFRRVRKSGQLTDTRLSDRTIANIVKAYAERIGLDPTTFSGHSLRAGFVTSAATRGASLLKIMDQSRHKSVEMVRCYVRDAELFTDHAGAGLL